ncbi:MAG: peptide-binding protein [Alphaproteobacteria bacterium CG_4_10_14_0_2_um_filter_63_37]|nr:MAG: peptide-binding protein [Proteobacteria bacterium CG1_02_64_396]PJA24109.1 MAG: peptide-binding protein [Alphaproteobacteria bacterium CG_4_10_14_0_2_um_filter_63_37]
MTRKQWTELLVLTLLLGSCSNDTKPSTPPPSPVQHAANVAPELGGMLISGSIGEASTLIPLLASDASSHAISGMVYSGLLRYTGDLRLVGDLAESFEISRDNLTLTFHLRKGVKWHDGAPFTAKDVAYTWDVTVDPSTRTAYAGDFQMVDTLETPDDFTVVVHYKEPFAPALASWATSILPAHLLEGKDIHTSELASKPVGTGPYRFGTWERGAQITLTANPDYFGGTVWIDRDRTRVIPDTASQFLELKSGGIDSMGLTPPQYVRQTQGAEFQKKFEVYRYVSNSYTYLGFNLKNPLFEDVRVRQAIAYAIDTNELIEGVLMGQGIATAVPYKPGHWAANTALYPYPHDPEKAKALLKEAGWEDHDSDGILDKDGHPFRFTVVTNQGNKMRESTAIILQQRLAKLGIEMKIRIVEWAAFLKQFIDTREFEATILGWGLGNDPDQFDIFHSSKIKAPQLNFLSFDNPEVDRLLVEGRTTFDQATRKKTYDRFQEILHEQVPLIPLYAPYALVAVDRRVHGIAVQAAGIDYNREEWFIPKAEQVHPTVAP